LLALQAANFIVLAIDCEVDSILKGSEFVAGVMVFPAGLLALLAKANLAIIILDTCHAGPETVAFVDPWERSALLVLSVRKLRLTTPTASTM
jgi:hypothetical protein